MQSFPCVSVYALLVSREEPVCIMRRSARVQTECEIMQSEEDPRREPYPRTDAQIEPNSDALSAVIDVHLCALISHIARGISAPNQKKKINIRKKKWLFLF